jgi:4-hydroxy-tetrahydrodipicolinate reductase
MMEPELRARVEAACARGNSSLHASGSSPGFITEALPITHTSLQRRLDLFSIDEFANCTDGCSEEMLTSIMGFGETPEVFAHRNAGERDQVFEHSMSLIASAIGLPLDRFAVTSEFAVVRQRTKLHTQWIEAGTVGGQRVVNTGFRNGKPLFRFRANWFVTMDLDPAWELRQDGWRVTVTGDTPLDVTISFPIPAEERVLTLPRLTAHRPVNAIPHVCAAAPGIVSSVALGQVIARLE